MFFQVNQSLSIVTLQNAPKIIELLQDKDHNTDRLRV